MVQIGYTMMTEQAGPRELVGHVVGAPDPVRQARELAGVPSERAVFVGDTVWDMEAALRDGVTPVAVLSGGIPRADLETVGAQSLCRDPANLLGSLDSSVFADGE